MPMATGAVVDFGASDARTGPEMPKARAILAGINAAVVGILLLVIGTWYHGQLEKVRRATAEPTPGADADPAVQPAPAVQPDPSAAPAPGPDADPMR